MYVNNDGGLHAYEWVRIPLHFYMFLKVKWKLSWNCTNNKQQQQNNNDDDSSSSDNDDDNNDDYKNNNHHNHHHHHQHQIIFWILDIITGTITANSFSKFWSC